MVRRSTWLALVVLAALIGFAVYLRQKPAAPAVTETSTPSESQSLFGSGEGLVSSIRIGSAAGETIDLELGSDKAWAIKQPIAAAADQGQAEAAATQIEGLRNLRQVDLALETVGLAKPAYTFTIGFTGGKSHTLEIGDKTPSGTGYYAALDGGKVIIVSGDGITSLLDLLTAPPYLETPTPSPVPATETPVPTEGTPVSTEAPATPTP